MFKVCRLFLNLSVSVEDYNRYRVEIFRLNIIFLIFTKTSLPKYDVYIFKQLAGTIPGDVPHRSSQLFQASRYRQFLHIAFVHDVDEDWGTLANSEPQTL